MKPTPYGAARADDSDGSLRCGCVAKLSALIATARRLCLPPPQTTTQCLFAALIFLLVSSG